MRKYDNILICMFRRIRDGSIKEKQAFVFCAAAFLFFFGFFELKVGKKKKLLSVSWVTCNVAVHYTSHPSCTSTLKQPAETAHKHVTVHSFCICLLFKSAIS